MIKDFEQTGHKNIELLRFYLSKDIKRIDAKIQRNDSNMLGYFVGSLVDILIVIFFEDLLKDLFETYDNKIQITIKIIVIVCLIVIFMVISWITKRLRDAKVRREKASGKRQYYINEEKQEQIDDFDNIACDGLLIYRNYMEGYKHAREKYIKDFYLYEIIHHLSKAAIIFNNIYENQKLYISSEDDQLLDRYRVNNFIVFSRQIYKFLKKEIAKEPKDEELKSDMINLEALVNRWKMIQQ